MSYPVAYLCISRCPLLVTVTCIHFVERVLLSNNKQVSRQFVQIKSYPEFILYCLSILIHLDQMTARVQDCLNMIRDCPVLFEGR